MKATSNINGVTIKNFATKTVAGKSGEFGEPKSDYYSGDIYINDLYCGKIEEALNEKTATIKIDVYETKEFGASDVLAGLGKKLIKKYPKGIDNDGTILDVDYEKLCETKKGQINYFVKELFKLYEYADAYTQMKKQGFEGMFVGVSKTDMRMMIPIMKEMKVEKMKGQVIEMMKNGNFTYLLTISGEEFFNIKI